MPDQTVNVKLPGTSQFIFDFQGVLAMDSTQNACGRNQTELTLS